MIKAALTMKKIIILLSLFLSVHSTYSQKKMKIVFADGTEKTGDYRIKLPMFSRIPIVVSHETNEKYKLDQMQNVTLYDGTAELYYEIIDAKDNMDDAKTEKVLGLLIYNGPKAKLFGVEEAVNSATVAPYQEIYIRKKDDKIAYNIGYIYGVDARSAKKRLRDYFADCPSLVEQINNNEINKEKSIEITKYYETNCGGK